MNLTLKKYSALISFALLALTICLVKPLTANATGTTTVTFDTASASNGLMPDSNGNYAWTVPTGVTSVNFSVWSAGGNGGGKILLHGTAYRYGNGGGGSGLVTGVATVVPGQTYTVHVGRADLASNPANFICSSADHLTDSWFTSLNACPYSNSSLYVTTPTAGNGSSGGGTTYTATGTTGINFFSGGGGGTGGGDTSLDTAFGGGGGGAGGGGTGAIAGECNTSSCSAGTGANGSGSSSWGGGNGGDGAIVSNGYAPGGGAVGTGSTNNYGSQGGAGRVIISYTAPASFIDIGLRVAQSSGTVHIAIEATSTASSKLEIAKNGVTYHVALVATNDANATKIHVQLGNGTVMALRSCTVANGCTYVP